MKKLFFKLSLPASLVLVIVFASGCKKLNIEKEIRIDFASNFENDYVTLKLDNDEVFTGNLSSNQVLGVAEIVKFDYPIGKYEITVNVNGIEKTEKFRHKEDRFIYISFDRDSGSIAIDYPDEPYIYE